MKCQLLQEIKVRKGDTSENTKKIWKPGARLMNFIITHAVGVDISKNRIKIDFFPCDFQSALIPGIPIVLIEFNDVPRM